MHKQQQRTLATQMQNALLQYQQDMKQFNYFQQEALPNAKEIVSAAQLGYKTGDIGYVEYLFCLTNRNRYSVELPQKYSAGQPICNQYLFIHQSISTNEIQYKKKNHVDDSHSCFTICFFLPVKMIRKEDKSAETKTAGKEEAPHEEETPTIATLTEEQIKTVGIQLGHH